MIPKHVTFSAPPGKPSILWIGKSGRKYRNLVAAKIDKAENAYIETGNQVGEIISEVKSNSWVFILMIAIITIVVYKLLK
jgi:hypothetical protein